MHIDALDAAAALPGIVGRAIHQRIDGGIEVGVLHDVARVLAAELEPDGGEGARGGALD